MNTYNVFEVLVSKAERNSRFEICNHCQHIGSLTNDSHERGSHLIRDLLRLSSKGLAKQVDREVQDPRGVFDHGLAASDALVEVQALREDVVAGQVAGSLKKATC